MKNIVKDLLLASAFILSVVSCGNVKSIAYFQDTVDKGEYELAPVSTITADVSDMMSIVVHSKNPELANIFNLFSSSNNVNTTGTMGGSGGNNYMRYYTVDSNGDIDMPVLGSVHVGGLTREEIANLVKTKIIEGNYIMDAVVTVEFSNLCVSVLGEVAHPGRLSLDKDRFTILDAIAKAGDLTIQGVRPSVKVYREINGVQKCFALDMTNAESLFMSPVYYLKQDDVIYVEPSDMRKRQSTVNGNNFLSVPFWISVGSFVMSVTTMIMTSVKK